LKLRYFFGCILAAGSLLVSPGLSLGRAGHGVGNHGFGGGHGFGGSPGFFSGRGFSQDSSQSRGFSAGGLHGGRFQGRFGGDSSGSAFGMGCSARGGPHVFMGQGIGREFAFRHDDRFIDRDHRLFNRDQHHFFFDFDFAAFGFPSWTPPTSYPAVILFDDIVSRY
jgi:hypothetical protein